MFLLDSSNATSTVEVTNTMKQIPSHDYLQYALNLTRKETALLAEFSEWLPDSLIDVHSHANGAAAVEELPPSALKQVRTSFPDFSVSDSNLVRQTLYGTKQVKMLRFANPYKGINHRKANRYLLENAPEGDRVALCGLPDNLHHTIAEIYSDKYEALKMYPYYFDPPATKIKEYFPDEILHAAQSVGLPIILHTPTPLAFCIDEVLEIARQYPDLTIVLAHLGRQREATTAAEAAFSSLARCPNVVTDISMNTSVSVHRLALEWLGPERVLFGTDEPMNLLRFVEYQHPVHGRRFISDYRYHWLDTTQYNEYRHLGTESILLHLQVLVALRQALETFPRQENQVAKEQICHSNALRVFPGFA